MIFGRPGSGKSTVSLDLAATLDLPLIHMDRWYFKHGWEVRDTEEFMEIQRSFVKEDRWLIEGNALSSLETRYARSDLAICFMYPRWLSLWRIFKRLWHKNPKIKDRAPGAREKLTWKLITYSWTFDTRINRILPQLQAKYPDVALKNVRNDKELQIIKKHLKGAF